VAGRGLIAWLQSLDGDTVEEAAGHAIVSELERYRDVRWAAAMERERNASSQPVAGEPSLGRTPAP
jgi:hypothetical protein